MVKPSSQDFLRTVQVSQDSGVARKIMAIASPCSTCKNMNMDADSGYAICPRRFWKQQASLAAAAGTAGPPPYLTDPGYGAANGFVNPVTSQSTSSRVVWAATLDENKPLLNLDGSVKNPDILDPNFDTTYIQCRQFPYVAAQREANYYAGGQIVEGDTLLLDNTKFTQLDSNSMYENIQIGGYCEKMTAVQKFFITPAKKTVNQQGT